jgi:DNA processing protein
MEPMEHLAPPGDARAWLGLALVPGLTPARAWELVKRFGSADAVLDAGVERLVAAGLSERVAKTLVAARAVADREHARIRAAGAALVAWSDERYPSRLRTITDPPLALAVRGSLVPADTMAVAVVGARRASEYGRRLAEELAGGLALAGLTVVSGLAAGIDATAHRAALAAGGRTLAVLGTGIDLVYPAWHASLAAEIARQGALVTEFACGAPPLARHFPQRNRVLSGLAVGTVVVEAAEESGSLITARFAMEEGRDVFAVPGPVGVSGHRGPHRLIREGAKLVTCVEDVLAEIAPGLTARVAASRARAAVATLTPAERDMLDAIGDGRHVDEVIHRAGVSAGVALETLLALELRGLVRQLPGKRFRRAA